MRSSRWFDRTSVDLFTPSRRGLAKLDRDEQSQSAIPQRIVGFHQDEEKHWVAELECGHTQHVRHDPPWQTRPWVTTEAGRSSFLGQRLMCIECCRKAR
ncbi:MAG TPA: DUF3565 domain-containing protein [Gemmatimonadaceae bacterium]